jgi:hypothetical protein
VTFVAESFNTVFRVAAATGTYALRITPDWPEVGPAVFRSLVIARRLHRMNLTLPAVAPSERDRYLADHATHLRDWMGWDTWRRG